MGKGNLRATQWDKIRMATVGEKLGFGDVLEENVTENIRKFIVDSAVTSVRRSCRRNSGMASCKFDGNSLSSDDF